MLEINKNYHGNCLEIMKEISDKSIDLILTDLPYGKIKAQWDKPLSFKQLWSNYERIIKDDGIILLTATQPFTSEVVMSNLKIFRYEWIWEKTQATGFFNAKKMPMMAHESILVFYKNLPTYNPQKTNGHKPVNSYTKKVNVFNKTNVYGHVKQEISGGGNTDRYPRTVQIFASDKQKTKLNGTIHPSQKPVALFEYLIKTYTNKGDLVLDSCMGSGTTAIACINTMRNWIGIEKELKYIKMTEKRIRMI